MALKGPSFLTRPPIGALNCRSEVLLLRDLPEEVWLEKSYDAKPLDLLECTGAVIRTIKMEISRHELANGGRTWQAVVENVWARGFFA